MGRDNDFDILISSDKKIKKIGIKNFAELLFKKLPNRSENCDIILSHENERYLKISLKRLRFIVLNLFKKFKDKKIKPGDTIILADLLVTNVSYISLIFTALAAYGCRVMLPMWIETREIKNWIKLTNPKAIIFPENEINNLSKHEKEKQILKEIRECVKKTKVDFYDIEQDFKISKYVKLKIPNDFNPLENILVKKIIKETNKSNEIAIFTTSGTSGRSKLVVYDQEAYINTIVSYEASGLYKKGKMLGRTFIDIFPHSVSIRSLVNALWTGSPICMITSDLIKNSPEKTFPFLISMKPEVITLGPSSFGLVVDFIKLFPEIKKQVFSELKTIVSTGSSYSKKISDDWLKQTGLVLHNAYGLIETQQFTSTVISNSFNPSKPSLGKPFAGVTIGLKKYNYDTYKLYVKTCFGHKYLIDPSRNKKIYPNEFLDTKDIVKIDECKNIFFSSRQNLDYVKNGFGAKVPIKTMEKYYKSLYSKVDHIEYYATETMSFNLGIASLIFICEKNIEKGRVTDKKTIKKYSKIIKNINKILEKTIEPFEFDNRAISRFLLINSPVPKTRKNTISKHIIDVNYKDEICDLKKSNNKNIGVTNILRTKQKIFFFLQKILPVNSKIFRSLILKIIKGKDEIIKN